MTNRIYYVIACNPTRPGIGANLTVLNSVANGFAKAALPEGAATLLDEDLHYL